jgi:DNA-binding CsgD family transcriptional regulator
LGFDLAEANSVLVVQYICSNYLATLYKELGKVDSALFFLEEKEHLLKRINHDKAAQQLLAKEISSKYENRQREIIAENTYRSGLFWLTLFLLLSVLAIFFFLFVSYRKKNNKLSLDLLGIQLKSKQLQLERELLETQLEEKDRELTANLMYSLKKNQIIKDSVEKLIKHRKVFNPEGNEVVRKVIHDLNNSQEEKIFQEFEISFLKLHEGFYDKLHKDFPGLTLNENRLCAFMRLNLSSKEISSITGQTLPTLNMAKTRLKRKLGLTNSDQSLYQFLAKY